MPEHLAPILVTLASIWIALIVFSRWLRMPYLRPDDFEAAFLVRFIKFYARVVHNLQVEGRENIPSPHDALSGRGLIVAANHTAGIDPLLIQAALEYEPRWMMADDMRHPMLETLWRFAEIIFVDRTNGDSRALRTALRHLQDGKILGVFPEGYIERPERHLLPFQPGIGLLVKKSRAPVLPIVIEGTPQASTAWGSIHASSRSRIRILPVVHYEEMGLSSQAIVDDLRERFVGATSWPDAPRTPILTKTRRISVDLDGRYIDEDANPVSDDEAREIALGD